MLLSLFLVGFSGCNQALRSVSLSADLNQIPSTFENTRIDQPSGRDLPPENTKTKIPIEVKPPQIGAASNIIFNAQKVMETEGQKVGTACNIYLHRVLQKSGFANVVYLATNFDIYATKYFSHFKSVNFGHDGGNQSDVNTLKRHLWSYPERTPFITQWSRSGANGHIALVERIGEKLVIYQASLGKYLPRKDQTTPDILLNGYNRRQLTVYSEMTPK